MSKKKFSEGLDDLFKETPATEEAWEHVSDTPARERKAGSKNFMHDLDELFHEALDEPGSASAELAGTPSTKSKSTAATRSTVTGLDALIRQTIDVREIQSDEASGKKRLTVAIDKEKVRQIKAIARLENAYLKDLMAEVIEKYIQEYTRDKGIDLS